VCENRVYSKPNAEISKGTSAQVAAMRKCFVNTAAGGEANAEAEGEEGAGAGDAIGFIPDISSDNKHLYP